jgi:hypothetical protein
MKSTKRLAGNAPTTVATDDPFEAVRADFHAKLRSDRAHLMSLGAMLVRTEDDPGRIFAEIRLVARRLRGASAIFEAHEIGLAADVLEQAAFSASVAHAGSSDACVWTALEALIDRLPSNSKSSTVLKGTAVVSRPTAPCERKSRR